jgi:hypothetical protein
MAVAFIPVEKASLRLRLRRPAEQPSDDARTPY